MRMSVTVPPDVTRTTHRAHDPDALGEVERLSGRTPDARSTSPNGGR